MEHSNDSATINGTTHVLMVVDMSGSMWNLAEDVRGGFNSYVAGLRDQHDIKVRLTAAMFDERYLPLTVDASLDEVPALTAHNYAPAGRTALYDALGKTIGDFDSRVVLGEHDRVICVVQTDGQENASQDWTGTAIRKLIKDREAGGRWGFVYIGTGLDSWSQAESLGYSRDTYVNTAATSTGTAATYGGLRGMTVSYAGGQSVAGSTRVLRDEAGK